MEEYPAKNARKYDPVGIPAVQFYKVCKMEKGMERISFTTAINKVPFHYLNMKKRLQQKVYLKSMPDF